MKYSFLRKHLFLLLAFFYFVISIFFFFLDNQKYNSSLVRINKKISKELKEADRESQSIVELISKSDKPTFASLLKEKKYSYFVFRNKGLFFWSDYHFSASYESLKGNYKAKYVHLKNGKFLVTRSWLRKRGDIFEVFFFIPLSYHYSIENNYISSGLNRDIFKNADVGIHSFPFKDGMKIYSNSQEYLFSMELLPHSTERNNLISFLFSFAGIVFAVVYLLKIINREQLDGNYKTGFWYLLLSLLGIRAIIFYFNYPFNLTGFDVFNSKYFASSFFVPSLGDFLINTFIIAFLLVYILINFPRLEIVKKMYTYNATTKYIIYCLIIIIQYYVSYYFFYFSREIFLHSQWSADIMENISFGILRFSSLVGFVLLYVIFFIITHLLYRIIFMVSPAEDNGKAIYLFLGSALAFSAIAIATNTFHWFLLVTTVVYFFIVYYSDLPRSLSNISYFTYIYFLVSGILFSMQGAYAIMDVNERKTRIDKERFFETVFAAKDELGEYLLYEASQKIERDPFVTTRYLDPFSSKDLIDHKIRRAILSDYFDKYDISIDIFGKDGMAFYPENSKINLSSIEQQISDKKYKTQYPGIYFINDTTRKDNFRKYIASVPLFYNDTSFLGTIIIELKPRRYVPYSVYPELLVDRKFIVESENKNYSYGIFSDSKLTYSSGDFDYGKFDKNWLKFNELYSTGTERKGYDHLGIKQDNNRVVVITSPAYSFFSMFSNFSFLFFILIIFILLFIVLYSLTTQAQGFSFGFSTKIQIYLNIAFFLPLLIVCITILSVISFSYRNSLEESFIKKAETIRNNIEGPFERALHDQISKEQFYGFLSQLARYTQSDINLYNKQGKLLYSNQPLIYGIGILSRFINPQAYVNVNGRNNAVIVSEYAGRFRYSAVYIDIKSGTGQTDAILSIPFFHSKQDINKQLINVLTTTLNIFVSIFILLLLLSYFASQLLTAPLSLITAKLRKTSLTGKNEPLSWNNSKDEIGMLIEGYNEMIVKLDESRDALSRSEKEAAWREMAKQVAHEIKNPLTPMKLTIQHLQRTLKENKEDKNQVEKSMDVLLHQVNTLNEIASSFSSFAKMPVPKVQDFEITSLLIKSVALHNNTHSADVEVEIEKGKFYVRGDEQLMGGIFTNLIINAIQAVPVGRKPVIQIRLLLVEGNKITIEVRDNGEGIPEGIRDKVFNLNFSTKIGGSGIGLAVAKRGVEHAGGKIWFETIMQQGTSFFIELPLLADGFKK